MIYSHPVQSRSFEQYVKEELAYYDQHPEKDDASLEAHSNSYDCYEIDYTTQS